MTHEFVGFPIERSFECKGLDSGFACPWWLNGFGKLGVDQNWIVHIDPFVFWVLDQEYLRFGVARCRLKQSVCTALLAEFLAFSAEGKGVKVYIVGIQIQLFVGLLFPGFYWLRRGLDCYFLGVVPIVGVEHKHLERAFSHLGYWQSQTAEGVESDRLIFAIWTDHLRLVLSHKQINNDRLIPL